ncbi:putative ribonuclease H-like domain-containing protein [Tanacetum coccineum]
MEAGLKLYKKNCCSSSFNKYGFWLIYPMVLSLQELKLSGLCLTNHGLLLLKIPSKDYNAWSKPCDGITLAPSAWYANSVPTFLEKHGYKRGTIDKTLFIRRNKKDIMLVQVYVDDIIFGSTNKSWCDEFEALMQSRFQMSSMGELTFFLGLQVKQKKEGIFISQEKYVAEILKKFDLVHVKAAITPMETKLPLTKDEEAFDVDVHLYRSMIGSLMYLTASRPDIMYAVCVCSRFQVTPKFSSQCVVKRIFKYLKGKPNLGLWYPRDSPLNLEAFSDSDYGGSNLDRKSTTGGCQFLGQRLISWQCKKQTIVATLHNEAEYNPVYHSKTKHIEIRHHFIRDCYEKKLISVEKIHTDLNVADLYYLVFEKSDARSTWAWKRKCQVSLANWMQFGLFQWRQPQAPKVEDDLFWSSNIASGDSYVAKMKRFFMDCKILGSKQWREVNPLNQVLNQHHSTVCTCFLIPFKYNYTNISILQLTCYKLQTLPTQPVQTTSPPPVSTIPDIQPTLPPSPQIPSPSYHDTEGPSFEPSYHMSPPPSHEPEIQASISSEKVRNLENLMDILIEKVKKLENKLRKKRKSKEAKDAENQDQEVPFETDQGDTFVTPEKSKGSGEAQEEQISPSTLEAAQAEERAQKGEKERSTMMKRTIKLKVQGINDIKRVLKR